jgi:DNA polymerase-3 subunit delta'
MIDLAGIVGQAAAVGRLQEALTGKRMPHAFIFAGPEGIGRRTTAIAFAATLLCESPLVGDAPAASPGGSAAGDGAAGPGGEPARAGFRRACGRCDDCRMIDADCHADLHLIRKELAAYHDDAAVRERKMQELGIDVIRSFLIARAHRAAARGRGKVFIVLEAELLSDEAQNALLKTLEEPPPGVTILLVCEQPDRLLPTTLSRCAMVRFSLLPGQFVRGKLAEAGVGGAEAAFWAAFTGGSLGRAQKLAARGLYEVKREALDLVSSAGAAAVGDYLRKAAEKLAATLAGEAKQADGGELAATVATRRAAGTILELLAGAFRDAMGLAAGRGEALINADQRGAVEAVAARFDAAGLAAVVERLSRCEELLWRNVNPKIVWDNAAIACTSRSAVCR